MGTMERREFLQLAATASAFALSGAAGPAFAKAGDEWKTAFHAALKEKPYLLGWLGSPEARLETASLKIDGKWPAGLEGTFYRNGPGRNEVGGLRYRHWFDGDGMVQAFRIAGGKVSHLGRIVETAKYTAERQAGKALRPAFGTNMPGMVRPPNPDSVNTANISVLWHADRLLALWEAGSPHELDPRTLETKGAHYWSAKTRGLPFGAHPRVDRDGTLWNIGYGSGFGVLILYRIGPDGKLKQAVPIKLGKVPMVHDFVITERHLVAILPPLFLERGAGPTILDSYVWQGKQPARVLIVEKSDLSRRKLLEMPSHFTFHYGNAWEDSAGIIRMDEARYPDPSVIFGPLRDVMRGAGSTNLPARQTLVAVDTKKGRITESPLTTREFDVEFPHVDLRRTGRRYRKVTTLLRDPKAGSQHPLLNTVARVDVETGALTGYTYGATVIPEEHLFVPRRGGTTEDDGWIIGTSLDFEIGVTRVSVFDAAKLREGPLAVAKLPYALPLGFHGTFVAG